MSDELTFDTPFMVKPDDFDLGVGTIMEPGALPVGTQHMVIRVEDKESEPLVLGVHPDSLMKILDFIIRHRAELKPTL